MEKPTKEEIVDIYVNQRKSLVKTGDSFGVSTYILRKWMKEYHIPFKTHKEACIESNNKNREISKPPKELLSSLYEKHSVKHLEKVFSVGQESIYLWLDEYDIPRKGLSKACLIGKNNSFQNRIPTKEEILKAYTTYGNLSYLCDHFNVSGTLLQRWIKHYGLKFDKPWRSKAEIELFHTISNTFPNLSFTPNDKSLINPFELDIVSHEKKVAIEYCGHYWHSELFGKPKDYHLNKRNLCLSKGYTLYTIFEKDWHTNKELLLSMFRSRLGQNIQKIYARKCNIYELSSSEASEFFRENHISGNVGSSIVYGLYDNLQLVSAMSFGKSRFSKDYEWEILRFANKRDTTVVGGCSKLFSHFCKQHNVKSCVSYCDLRYGEGNVYGKLGFEKLKETAPNYWYFSNSTNKMYSRVKFQKHKLKDQLKVFDENLTEWENMKRNGWNRIWDCGNSVFVYRK